MPFEPRPSQQPFATRPFPSVQAADAVSVERTFMAGVYRWMSLGLALTALVAWQVASSEAALRLIVGNRMVFYGLMFAELGLVIAITAMVPRLSAAAAGGLFLLYSALNGATLSVILLIYTGDSIASAFGVTAGTFAAMSVYGTVTKRDLTSWGSFLFMGLIGVVIAGLVNLFLRSDGLSFVLSCAAVVVFTGLTAYDTQKLRAWASAGGGQVAAGPVAGALSLYLDFINLFLAILRLFGKRR
jgi:FtsH-binding integral membrane protein